MGRGGTEKEANAEFDQLDTDKDGKLTKEEFRMAFPELRRRAAADATFAEIDTDGDGFLSRAEVIAFQTKQGSTEERANELFDKLDTNKDGKVSKEELRKAFDA